MGFGLTVCECSPYVSIYVEIIMMPFQISFLPHSTKGGLHVLRLMGYFVYTSPLSVFCLQEGTSRKMQIQATSSKGQREESAIHTQRM